MRFVRAISFISKVLLWAVVIALFGLQAGSIVLAQDNAPAASESFKTEATSTYDVDSAGTTVVEHQFKITNLKPTTYLKQYQIKLQFPNLSAITATDQGQPLEPAVTKDGVVTAITLNFGDDVIGEGKSRTFTIGYATQDLSVGSGNVLELRIPPLQGAADTQHQVVVSVPSKYALPVRSNPQPESHDVGLERLQLRYNSFAKDGISALFGTSQTYRLATRYSLKNPSTSQGYTQIALPPDTSFQRMEYRSLEPKPDSMKADADGNWIATYTLPANSAVPVELTSDVTVTLEADPIVPVPQPLPEHVAEKPYWEVANPVLTTFTNTADMKTVYQKVIDTLHYDTKRVEQGDITQRYGAVEALASPTAAVCQEYSDVLISAWRNINIPARRLNGYAFSQNEQTRPLSFRGTVLHAWVDYYDPEQNLWKQVDPTWQDTTGGVDYFHEFDLNHVVLSIYGLSSNEPAPAGSYTESPEEASLQVSVIEPTEPSPPQFSGKLIPKKLFGIEIPGSYKLTLTNESGRAWYDTQLSFDTQSEAAISASTKPLTFLPFEEESQWIEVTSDWQQSWQKVPIEITLLPAGQTEPYVVTLEKATSAPATVIQVANLDPSTPLGILAVLSIFTAGSLLVFRRKRKTPVRWKSQELKKTT
jgi:transglutaminase-like putative cysteine protease